MSKQEKITEEQLEKLQKVVKSIQTLQSEIGGLEAKKHVFLHQLLATQEVLQNLQEELKEQYGEVSISIEDGSISEQSLEA